MTLTKLLSFELWKTVSQKTEKSISRYLNIFTDLFIKKVKSKNEEKTNRFVQILPTTNFIESLLDVRSESLKPLQYTRR